MNEAFNLGLHAPVSKLHFAKFVGTHDGSLPWVVVVFLYPVILQGPPLGLLRLVKPRVLLCLVLMWGDGICHYVDRVCQKKNRVSGSSNRWSQLFGITMVL